MREDGESVLIRGQLLDDIQYFNYFMIIIDVTGVDFFDDIVGEGLKIMRDKLDGQMLHFDIILEYLIRIEVFEDEGHELMQIMIDQLFYYVYFTIRIG